MFKPLKAVHKLLLSLGVIGAIGLTLGYIALVVGWFMNIYKVIVLGFSGMPFADIGVELFVRAIGIPFWIIGAIAGYFG